jgi:hypothetical protein
LNQPEKELLCFVFVSFKFIELTLFLHNRIFFESIVLVRPVLSVEPIFMKMFCNHVIAEWLVLTDAPLSTAVFPSVRMVQSAEARAQ